MCKRHDLVWLSDQGWQRAREALDKAPAHCRDIIEMWRQADWPAIVRRADADLLPEQLSVGIAMPPRPTDGCKIRIGLRVSRSDVKKVLPPLSVAQINEATPASWRPFLTALDRDAGSQGLTIRVYGSVALQALTRQPYLTATSDIDVLLRPMTRAQLHRGLNLLNSYARNLPLDGEIIFPDGQAVAWKELSSALRATCGTRVLVKEMHGVYLATTNALLATMKDDVCMS
jgi:phosphoribosyl-dephospho-CoA transferase